VSNVNLVEGFLKGQNYEQIGRVDEAIALYEAAVAGRFDAIGPYDRLIALYSGRAQHADVVRVASVALECVRTHPDKRAWYERMKSEAERASARVPRATPKPRDR
jgi:hypothetical protein